MSLETKKSTLFSDKNSSLHLIIVPKVSYSCVPNAQAGCNKQAGVPNLLNRAFFPACFYVVKMAEQAGKSSFFFCCEHAEYGHSCVRNCLIKTHFSVHHLPISVGPKQLCASAHLRCTHEVVTS